VVKLFVLWPIKVDSQLAASHKDQINRESENVEEIMIEGFTFVVKIGSSGDFNVIRVLIVETDKPKGYQKETEQTTDIGNNIVNFPIRPCNFNPNR
jgi:hypothetical protein